MAEVLSSSAAPSNVASIRLFDPNRFLAIIVVVFWPLRFFPILLTPAVILAGLTTFKHWGDITADLHRLLGEFSFVIHALLSLLIVNLGVRLSMGAVLRASGATVRDFGIIFFLGIIPRFYVDRSAIPGLDRKTQLWAYGAPLMVRLGFFAFGTLAWATYRSEGTWLPSLALLISQAGLWSFLYAVIPLLPGDGYNWLATYFRQPFLRQKALIVLSAKLRGKRLPAAVKPGEIPILIVFAVSVVLALLALALAILIVSGLLLTEKLQGTGAAIFLVLVVGVALWLINLRTTMARRKQQSRQARLLQAMMASRAAAKPTSGRTASWRPSLWVTLTGIAVALTVLALLPYSYDVAGPFRILPTQRGEAIAQTDGMVVDATVREGEWVSVGQVLAHLSSLDQERDLALAKEELGRAEARLAQLEANTSGSERGAVEPVADAERNAMIEEVERLRRQSDADVAALQRTAIRAPVAGFVTTPNPQLLTGAWLNVGDAFLQIEDSKVVEAEIEISQRDIDLVKPGAKVRLRPWSERKTEIVGEVVAIAPVVLNKSDRARAHLDRGVSDGIQIPRLNLSEDEGGAIDSKKTAYVGNISMGMLSSSTNADSLIGHATSRSETAAGEQESADKSGLLRVRASVPDSGTLLRPAMTGYAKITGVDMTIGEAFFRLCSRFLTVELWSWVP